MVGKVVEVAEVVTWVATKEEVKDRTQGKVALHLVGMEDRVMEAMEGIREVVAEDITLVVAEISLTEAVMSPVAATTTTTATTTQAKVSTSKTEA